MADPNGPQILSFSSNRTSIASANRYRDMVVLSAVVTDVDGVEDVIGGTLFVDGTTVSLGTFATAAQEGAYSISLDWETLLSPLPDNFAPWEPALNLPLRAEFFDQAGHKTSQTTMVRFECEAAGGDDVVGETVRPFGDGCELGTRCSTEEEYGGTTVNGCWNREQPTTGQQMCQEFFGTICSKCGANYPDGSVSCTAMAPELHCDCAN